MLQQPTKEQPEVNLTIKTFSTINNHVCFYDKFTVFVEIYFYRSYKDEGIFHLYDTPFFLVLHLDYTFYFVKVRDLSNDIIE